MGAAANMDGWQGGEREEEVVLCYLLLRVLRRRRSNTGLPGGETMSAEENGGQW